MPGRSSFLPRGLGAGLLGAAAALLPALAPQRAEALLLFRMRQVGSDVVITGGGTYVTTGLQLKDLVDEEDEPILQPLDIPSSGMQANAGYLQITKSGQDLWVWGPVSGNDLIGDPNFGTGDFNDQGVQNEGSAVAGIDLGFQEIFLPSGAACDPTSCTISSSTTTFAGLSFATLGVTPGTYTWSWGEGPDQTFQLEIEAPVPGPLPALGGAAAFGWSRKLRRRLSGASCKTKG